MPPNPYLFIVVFAGVAFMFPLLPLALAWMWRKFFQPQKPGAEKNAGSGKSTILPPIARLINTSIGRIYSAGGLVTEPNPDVTMVFQSFALLPWLTVLENVEIGLEAQ